MCDQNANEPSKKYISFGDTISWDEWQNIIFFKNILIDKIFFTIILYMIYITISILVIYYWWLFIYQMSERAIWCKNWRYFASLHKWCEMLESLTGSPSSICYEFLPWLMDKQSHDIVAPPQNSPPRASMSPLSAPPENLKYEKIIETNWGRHGTQQH